MDEDERILAKGVYKVVFKRNFEKEPDGFVCPKCLSKKFDNENFECKKCKWSWKDFKFDVVLYS